MNQNTKAILKSKLSAFMICYEEANKTKDLKRIVIFAPIISDLRDEIALLDD
ncbi:MAG TPA: hypothetical protein VHO94_04180 [Oscillospiraceae bacterium]|nr:hypothetical protein [Oscillospiraceae bacterium]